MRKEVLFFAQYTCPFKDIAKDILKGISEKYHVVFSYVVFYSYHYIFSFLYGKYCCHLYIALSVSIIVSCDNRTMPAGYVIRTNYSGAGPQELPPDYINNKR